MGARQDRHDRERQRQLAVVGAGKVISHGPVIRRVDAFHQRKGGALLRAPLGLEQVEGEHDVGRGDWRSVRELGGRIEMEDDLVARRIGFDALRDEAIERERLVGGARHQRLIDVADEALRCRQSLDVVRVQAVEGAEISEVEGAALGRLRIDVRQVVEVGRQGRLAMHRNRARRRTQPPAIVGAPASAIASTAPRRERIVRPIITALLSSGVGGFPMEGAPFARLALLAAIFASGAWAKGRNCYWNIASNMERGRNPQRVRRALRHEVARRLADANSWAPIGGVLAKGEAQDDFV